MYLETMSSIEINRIFQDDQEFINRNVLRIGKEWEKIARIKRPLPLHFFKSFKSNGKNEYLTTSHTRDGKLPGYNLYIAVYGNLGEKNYLNTCHNSEGVRNKYTAHFLKRYRERCVKKDISLEESLAIYMMDDKNALKIYEDEETHTHFVYANKTGLIFCTLDMDKKLMITKTYVDDSMLGSTQKAAKDKMYDLLSNLNQEEYILQILHSVEITKETQEIYRQYFDD